MGRLGVLCAVFLAVIEVSRAAGEGDGRKQRRSKWDDIDYDALEKEWEKGDSVEELLTDDKARMKKLEQGKSRQPGFDSG
jgi:hypothetical protein